ncbi:MAG TPA: threonine ammonia-lyase [Usitatibacteraceae bacterium]|nr:threonine ammonia-lyase [Usitatibacteraceae bacterium]
MSITLEDVLDARRVLAGHIICSPCLQSRTLSEITGANVFLKFENHQFTASFKERGALNKLASLDGDERSRGVIAASAGNHAQGVAHHASRLGIPSVIVMPRHTPNIKVEMTARHGARVILHGESFDDAKAQALTLASQAGYTFVHPYDDPKVIAGQGTVALEMLEQHPQIDTLCIAVGGGGLIAGVATAARSIKPEVEVIGVEMERFPSMYHALKGGTAQFGLSTIAEGIAVKEPGRLTQEIVARLVSDLLLVGEADVEEAIVMLLEIEKTVVEGAGAASLAALLAHRSRFAGRNVGVVLCGGNIDPLMLAGIIERGMVKSGRLSKLTVEIRDLPGALARITQIIADANANIEEVHHHRAFTHLPVQNAEVDLVLKTRNREHADQIIAMLAAAGFNSRAHTNTRR